MLGLSISPVTPYRIFNPLDLSPVLWLDSSRGVFSASGESLAVDGETVEQWQDFSGNANHANQSTADSRPILKTNQLNGYPVLRFDGINDFLTVTHTDLLGITTYTLFAVVRPTVESSQVMVEKYIANTPFPYAMRIVGTPANKFSHAFYDKSTVTHTVATSNIVGSWNILTAWRDDTLRIARAFVNGTQEGGDTTYNQQTTSNTVDIGIGARPSGASAMTGDIAAILLFPSALADVQRLNVERFLATRYGLTIG